MSLYINPEQLRVGLYVQLDLRWIDHPFGFNNFKIKNADQIRAMQELGLERIRYDPERSSAKPLPLAAAPAPRPPVRVEAENPLIRAKRERAAYLQRYREAVAAAEQALFKAAQRFRAITVLIQSRPGEARSEAEALVRQLADTFLSDPDATVHAMGGMVTRRTSTTTASMSP